MCAYMRKTPRRWERPRAASRLERLGQRDLRASPGGGHCGWRALGAEGITALPRGHTLRLASPEDLGQHLLWSEAPCPLAPHS